MTPRASVAGVAIAFVAAALLSFPWDGNRALEHGTAAWRVPADGEYELDLRCSGEATARVDGRVVARRELAGAPRQAFRATLTSGLHQLEADCESSPRLPPLKLWWAAAGQTPSAFDSESFQRTRPLRARSLVALLAWILVACLLERLRQDGVLARSAAVRWFIRALPVLVVAYAAALRFEAVVSRYWLDAAPGWARTAAAGISWLRPGGAGWEPREEGYGGDPKEYLKLAAQPRGFYDAHHREPLFVFAVKAGLRLTGGQEVGGSIASALSSVLSVFAVYLVGANVFSRRVGLLAAALMAIEHDLVGLGATGNRDDTFIAFVLLFTWCALRLRDAPGPAAAVLAGITGAAATLTRITSLSCLLPGLAWIVLAPSAATRRQRLAWSAAALLVMLALVAPYLVSCAIAFGDPFEAIDVHTVFYQAKANVPAAKRGVADYLLGSRRPWALADTLLTGLTRFPFTNKWKGFEAWQPALGLLLAGCALAGLLMQVTSDKGRFLLLMLFSALLPFAFTWDLWGVWRLTAVAYPFYLLAAAAAVDAGLRLAASPRAALEPMRVTRSAVPAWAVAGLVGLVGAVVFLPPWLAYRRSAESLQAGEAVRIDLGALGGRFFDSGWSAPVSLGGHDLRLCPAPPCVLRLPVGQAGRRISLDVDRWGGSVGPASLSVSLDGVPLASLEPAPAQRIEIPGGRVAPGDSRLELASVGGGPFALVALQLAP